MTSTMIKYKDFGANLKDLTPVPKLTSSTDKDADQTLVSGVDDVDYTDFRFESARLNSYVNWPLSYIEPKTLAAAGFYYTSQKDAVKCFECGLVLRQWTQGDNPWVDHQQFSGHCRFLRGIPCGNVPIGADPDTILPAEQRSRDFCGIYGIEYRPNVVVNVPIQVYFENTEKPNTVRLGELQSAKHPEYANISDRVSTFETWPETKVQTKEQLAEAGFYYTKKEDRTICYYCGGGLEGWEPSDVPLKEHIKWFTKCKYALDKLETDNTNFSTSFEI